MKKLPKLLIELLRHLVPGIEGDDAPDDAPLDDDALPDLPDDHDLDDDMPDDDEPVPAPRARSDDRISRLEAEIAAAKAEKQRYEAEARTRNAGPTADQRAWEAEEQRLRDPMTSEQERWQIESNRVLRQTQAESRQALQQARDIADRAEFRSKSTSDPRRAKYEERVENELQRMRSQGQDAPREALYYYMLGKDIADGKMKPKGKTAPAANVPRGKSPAVRSDVNAKGGKTEQQKRAERLANINI